MLAHKGLQKQPEGVQKRKIERSSFFLFLCSKSCIFEKHKTYRYERRLLGDCGGGGVAACVWCADSNGAWRLSYLGL